MTNLDSTIAPLVSQYRNATLLLCGTYLALRLPRNFSFAHFFGYSRSKKEKLAIEADSKTFATQVLEESERSPAAKFLWSLVLKLLDYRKSMNMQLGPGIKSLMMMIELCWTL